MVNNVSPKQISDQVKTALQFIPKGWGDQNQLRNLFIVQRTYDLGENGDACSAYESLQRCLQTTHTKYLAGVYKFDIEGLRAC